MPARSFIGVWILIGLIGGAVVGINFGNLGPSLIIGVVACWRIGWGIDRLKGASKADSGGGSDAGYVGPIDGGGHQGGHHGTGHHGDGDGGGHGGDSGGGDGGGD
ncbi:hypothetical protein BH09PSE1_BH09PSE1_08600 [soil metagenome]